MNRPVAIFAQASSRVSKPKTEPEEKINAPYAALSGTKWDLRRMISSGKIGTSRPHEVRNVPHLETWNCKSPSKINT